MKKSTVKTAVILLLLITGAVFAAVAQTPLKVLHYTETTGYNHNTKTQSLGMFQADGAINNYVVTNDNDGSEFNSLANLQQYAVVVFSNTSGNSGLDANQRANFEAYIAGGGSYLGIHAASDTYRHSTANGNKTGTWDWYAENVAGASVQESPNHTNQNHNNTMTKQVPGHPALTNTPGPWNKTEEYYYWENGYLNNTFTELLRVGQTGGNSYDSPRMMAHCKDLTGGGKAFYTALGHSGNNYTSDQNFIQLISDAMVWMLPVPPPSLPIGWDYVNHFNHEVCWAAVDSDSVQIEKLSGDTWETMASLPADSCYEFRGCDGSAWFRLRAMNDLETQGRGIVSDVFQLRSKPIEAEARGMFVCGPESYKVFDMNGAMIRKGAGEFVDLNGLPAGVYSIITDSDRFLLGWN